MPSRNLHLLSVFGPLLTRLRAPSSSAPLEHHLSAIVECAQEGILVADIRASDAPILYVNQTFEAITGYSRGEAIGKNCRYLQGSDHLQPEIAIMRQALRAGTATHVQLRNYRKDGSLFWNDLHLVPLGKSGQSTHYVGFIRDVTEQATTAKQLQQMLYKDSLTGCLNREGLLATLKPLCGGHPLLLVKVDVAHFHDINSGYGYDLGDSLLCEIARRLATLKAAAVARVGSDQFAIAFACQSDAEPARYLSQINRCLGDRFDLPGAALTVRFASGYTLGARGDDPIMLVRQAGAALAQSNASQLRRPHAFALEAEQKALSRIRLSTDLQHGIAADEFIYHYQPKIDLQTDEIVGAEALLRWQHGLFGLQSPDTFIRLAENTGLILDIGAQGFRRVAAFAARVNASRQRPLRFAINVSAIELTHRDMVSFISEILEETGADPSWLTLELTERLIATNSPDMLTIFQRVRELGVGLSIDDFGTEYSSLRYLERFPVTEVKIDRSFISNLHHDAVKRIIVGAVIKLGAELDIDIVAEGIEQEGEREILRSMNCNLGQGYLFSPPLSEEHFAVLAQDGILPGKDWR